MGEAHPRATLAAIEAESEARVVRLRARLVDGTWTVQARALPPFSRLAAADTFSCAVWVETHRFSTGPTRWST